MHRPHRRLDNSPPRIPRTEDQGPMTKDKGPRRSAVRRPQIFGFFKVFGPFSRFFVVGEGAGGSGDPFSCSGIDFSCSGVEFSCSESIFRARRSIFDPRRWFFFGFRFVFVVGKGPGGSEDLCSCSGIDFSYLGIDFHTPVSYTHLTLPTTPYV